VEIGTVSRAAVLAKERSDAAYKSLQVSLVLNWTCLDRGKKKLTHFSFI